jgi:hypothetical protein
MNKISPEEKIKELQEKRTKYDEKLKIMYKNFKGVKHENSDSEIKYTMIKVYEDFIRSIDAEIKVLQASASSQAH